LVVVAAMLAAFVVVGAEPAMAQLPIDCHAVYVYKNVTVYKVHTSGYISCHDVFGLTDVLVDQQSRSAHLQGWGCAYPQTVETSKYHFHCSNNAHPHQEFAVSWLNHPPTACPAAASTPPASSVFTRTGAV